MLQPSKNQTALALALAALALTACGGGSTPLVPPAPGQPPIARLRLARFAAPAVSVAFDAGDSQAPGEEVAHYLFDFGDGTPALDAGASLVSHAYATEGVYAVSLQVTDVGGVSASVQTTLTVRQSPPACASSADCELGDTCALPEGLCTQEVGSGAP